MNCWETLGIKPGSSEAEIKTAFRGLAMKTHPDHGGSAEGFKRVFGAYEACIREAGVVSLNLDDIDLGRYNLGDLMRALHIEAFVSDFDMDSLIGTKIRFTFDGKHTHGHVEREELR